MLDNRLTGDMRRLVLAVVVGLALTLATACGAEPSPTERFAEALSSGDIDAAAALTDNPAAAESALTNSFDGMGRATVQVGVANGDTTELTWKWMLPRSRVVEYSTPVGEADGKVRWSLQSVHRDLKAGGRLLYTDDKTYDVPVVDRSNRPLLTWQEVTVVTLDPGSGQSARALAAELEPVAPTITERSIRADLKNAKSPVTVVALRPDDAKKVGSLDRIAGVDTRTEGRLLTASRTLRSPAVDGLEERWRESIDAAAGAAVLLADGEDRPIGQVRRFPGSTPIPVETTSTSRSNRRRTPPLRERSAPQWSWRSGRRPAASGRWLRTRLPTNRGRSP